MIVVLSFEHLNFGIVSNFGFRASDFLFHTIRLTQNFISVLLV